MKSTLMNFP
jgi:hypothetical protein